MAAVTAIAVSNTRIKTVRSASAQGTTGQTDWLAVPSWAKFATVYFNLTVITGTSSLIGLRVLDPIALNDTYQVALAEHTALTPQTAASMTVIDVGPGITGIADDVTNSATVNSYVKINAVLPPFLGLAVTNVVGAGTFTYTVSVAFAK